MATAEVNPSLETPAADKAERISAAPAPDAGLRAIEQQRQGAVVDTAVKTEQLAKELQEQNQPSAGEEPATPTIPATPAEAKEPEFLDSVLKYYDSSIERGKGPVGATFDAILYALTSGSTKLWDWVKGLFDGKKKEEETDAVAAAAEPPKAEEKPAASSEVEAKPFQEDLEGLMREFGITETGDGKKDFFLVAVELGKEVEEKYGIPYQVCVGQACLESGFGTSDLILRSFNSFGIQALGSYSGKRSGAYRAYDSLRDCFEGYGKLLSSSDIYKGAFQYKDDPKRFLEEIKRAGYAEDPNYVSKVIGAAAVYDLSLSNAIS